MCIDKRTVNFWELRDTVNRRRIWISSTGVIIPGLLCRAPELAIYREIMKEKMRYDDTAIY